MDDDEEVVKEKTSHRQIVTSLGADEKGAPYTVISRRKLIKAHRIDVYDKKLKRSRHVFVPNTDEVEVIVTNERAVWRGMILYAENNMSRAKAGGRDDTWTKDYFLKVVLEALQSPNVNPQMTHTFQPIDDGARLSIELREKRDTKVLKTLVKDLALPLDKDLAVKDVIKMARDINTERFYTFCRKGLFEAAKELAKIMDSIDLSNCIKKGWSPLQIAAYSGHYDIVQWLVETIKVDVNIKSEDGFYALMGAARGGHSDIVSFLLSKGAVCEDLNFVHESPCSYAVHRGHRDVVTSLSSQDGPLDKSGRLKNGKRSTEPILSMFQIPYKWPCESLAPKARGIVTYR